MLPQLDIGMPAVQILVFFSFFWPFSVPYLLARLTPVLCIIIHVDKIM